MKAKRLLSLPPYLFEELENRFREATSQGRDIVDLSIGDPDLRPPESIIGNLKEAVAEDRHHQYPPQRGAARLKSAIRGYVKKRCGVAPADDEILILIGSKEGLAHLPLAVCNPGDTVLVPDPGYPVYNSASQFAGCVVDRFVLEESRRFLPDFDELAARDLAGARLLLLNYPNNPTSAVATESLFEQALRFGRDHHLIVANDAAYADVYFDDAAPPLLCAQPGALDMPMIEFFSFSKTFCVTGWRVGFAVGNRLVIDALAHLKANIDSGVFGAIQAATAGTLETDGEHYAAAMRARFEKRRDLVQESLAKLGFQCFPTCATFYVWTRVPGDRGAMDYALFLLDKTDVLVTPGTGFGDAGEGYFRIALTQPEARIQEAVERIAAIR